MEIKKSMPDICMIGIVELVIEPEKCKRTNSESRKLIYIFQGIQKSVHLSSESFKIKTKARSMLSLDEELPAN